jgi:hypothetical protein
MKQSFYDWCIENNRQDLLDRWDYDLNKKSPTEVSCQSTDPFYFHCQNNLNHSSAIARLNHLIRGLAPLSCAECNSFAQWCTNYISEDYIEKYWCYDLNENIDPWKLSYKDSKTEVYLKCNYGHDHVYNVHPRGFVVGAHSCRVCNNKIVITGFNDLFTTNPELKEIWNFDKNIDIDPYKITYGVPQQVWWKCDKCKYEWKSFIPNVSKGHRCPECAKLHIVEVRRLDDNDFRRRVQNVNPNITIIGTYINNSNRVLCKCNVDGYEWNAWPSHLLRGRGCPVCANQIIVAGINDIATKRKDLIPYFKNQEESRLYTINSNAYIQGVCPNCGYEKDIYIGHLTNLGFGCPICSDGVSYPNKFMRNILKQLNIHFIPEFSPNWLDKRAYDVYFEIDNNKYAVEMDGGLGHGYGKHHKSSLTIEDLKERDIEKDELAIQHGIHVIRIDCNYKNNNRFTYIKENIIQSELNSILDLSNINWMDCDIKSQSSLVKQVCDFYNSNKSTIKNIANNFQLSINTIKRYLTKGTEFGWCNFS